MLDAQYLWAAGLKSSPWKRRDSFWMSALHTSVSTGDINTMSRTKSVHQLSERVDVV